MLKHSHRGSGNVKKVPRSATFKAKSSGVGMNETFSKKSKKKS